MGSIELQIAHGKTPIAFMIPYKKAKDPEVLRSIVRQRSGCDDVTKITMYNRAMKVIHWDDWEDIVEPDGCYVADIDDHWPQYTMGKNAGSGTSQLSSYLRNLAAQTSTAPSGSNSTPVGARSLENFTAMKQIILAKDKMAAANIEAITEKMAKIKYEGKVTHKVRYDSDEEEEGKQRIPQKAATKRVPPPANLSDGRHGLNNAVNEAVKQQNHRPLTKVSQADQVKFVASKEGFNAVQSKLLHGKYSKKPEGCPPSPVSISSKAASQTKNKREKAASITFREPDPIPSSKIRFRLIKPSERNRAIPAEEGARLLVALQDSTTPERILFSLGKNPEYTRLIVLVPAVDRRNYYTDQVITPDSILAGTTIRELGWPTETCITWEHIPNDHEKERRNPKHPWEDDLETEGEDDEY
ncbi:hypothetical protein ABW20_dc0103868 [Dactylellina cionopaga]|nr:hypothetical protein ABW20_dc0103868 [Dactylellina cionopaga]